MFDAVCVESNVKVIDFTLHSRTCHCSYRRFRSGRFADVATPQVAIIFEPVCARARPTIPELASPLPATSLHSDVERIEGRHVLEFLLAAFCTNLTLLSPYRRRREIL